MTGETNGMYMPVAPAYGGGYGDGMFGGTPGEIQLALSVNGFVRPLTIAVATPAAAEEFWHVSGDTTIDVPVGCCTDVAVVNATADIPITTRNLNVKVNRVA